MLHRTGDRRAAAWADEALDLISEPDFDEFAVVPRILDRLAKAGQGADRLLTVAAAMDNDNWRRRAVAAVVHATELLPDRPGQLADVRAEVGAATAPHLVALVRAGALFINGKLVKRPDEAPQPEAA